MPFLLGTGCSPSCVSRLLPTDALRVMRLLWSKALRCAAWLLASSVLRWGRLRGSGAVCSAAFGPR